MTTQKKKSGFDRALFDQILFDGSLKILILSLARELTSLFTEEGKLGLFVESKLSSLLGISRISSLLNQNWFTSLDSQNLHPAYLDNQIRLNSLKTESERTNLVAKNLNVILGTVSNENKLINESRRTELITGKNWISLHSK